MSTEASHSEEISFENQFNFEKIHLNSRGSDVNFLFVSPAGTQRLPAHKILLANESDVFAAMFFGELKEEGDVTVTDASVDAFKEFLKFFYMNRVKLTIANVAEVMNLGHKYNVIKCVDVCVRFLKGTLSADSACVGLNLALLYEQAELKVCCEIYISAHSDTVFKSKNFDECDKRALAHILQMDSLSCSETVIFEACMSWIKAKSKQNVVTKELIQEHLGDLFYDIRFTSMRLEEFAALSVAHGYAFSFPEYQEIIHRIGSQQVSSTLFNENPRKLQWHEKAMIVCDRKLSGSPGPYWNVSDNKPTKFESNQPIVLGMLIFAPINLERSFNVTVLETTSQSVNGGSTQTLADFKIKLPLEKETSITLPEPVLIRPEFMYEIRLVPEEQSTGSSTFKCPVLLTEVQMGSNINIKFHGDFKFPVYGPVNLITALGFN